MKELNYEFIKAKRLENKLSLQEVAEGLGFKNASTYLKYETGEYSFKADMLPTLSKILDCEIEDFFTKQFAVTEN